MMGGQISDRGQSTVIGAILIFAFAIAGLAAVQTFIVPQQNEAVELNHQATIDGEFDDLYAGLMNAADGNSNHTASISLGTRYPARLFTLNSPDPSGSLRTQDIGPYDDTVDGVDIESLCGLGSRDTQALTYEPNYNHLSGVGRHSYETSLKYQAVDDSLAEVDSGIIEGSTIRLRPLVGGSLATTSTGSKSTTFITNTTGRTPDPITIDSDDDSGKLTLPTTLSPDQWETIAEREPKIESVSVSGEVPDRTVTIDLADGDYRLSCTPIGVGGPPDNDPESEFLDDDDDSEGGEDLINPVNDGALKLDSVSSGMGPDDAIATFDNTGGEKTVTGVRAFYTASPGMNDPSSFEFTYNGNTVSGVDVGGDEYTDTGGWTMPANTDDLDVKINGEDKNFNPGNAGVGVALRVEEDGTESTNIYFIHDSA